MPGGLCVRPFACGWAAGSKYTLVAGCSFMVLGKGLCTRVKCKPLRDALP